MTTGLLLIAAALLLTVSNLREQESAADSAASALSGLKTLIGAGDANNEAEPAEDDSGQVFLTFSKSEDVEGISIKTGKWTNMTDEEIASAEQGEQTVISGVSGRWVKISSGWVFVPDRALTASEIADMTVEYKPGEIPDYMLNPEMDMPVKKVQGNYYIGVLEIPDLELELPIISQWSYNRLHTAPCRYYGSAYLDNMVICAHNYDRHFGRLETLGVGSPITFTDSDGNVFRYKVGSIEILKPRETERMKESEWDLTLFTCTIGGRTRVTVRCERVY